MKEYKAALDVPYEDIPYEIMTTDEGGWGSLFVFSDFLFSINRLQHSSLFNQTTHLTHLYKHFGKPIIDIFQSISQCGVSS
jgi:hypothetical protein